MSISHLILLTHQALHVARYDCDTHTCSLHVQHPILHQVNAITALLTRLENLVHEYALAQTTYHARYVANHPLLDIDTKLFEKIKQQFGLLFEPIRQQDIQTLQVQTAKAVLQTHHNDIHPFCLLEIDAYSTSILFYQDGETRAKTFAIGIQTLCNEGNDLQAMRTVAQQQLLRKASIFIDTFIITQGGRPTNCIMHADAPQLITTFLDEKPINKAVSTLPANDTLRRASLEQAIHKLATMNAIEKQHYLGHHTQTLLASIVLCELLFDILDYTQCYISGHTLCEGVAQTFCDR